MPKLNRSTLKNFFKNGNNPSQAHFADLIDSTINKIDDGFAKNMDDGLQLSPLGESNKVVSFYESVGDTNPNWQISVNPEERAHGLAFSDGKGKHRLFLGNNGNIGINTAYPRAQLDVRGTSVLTTRMGGYIMGKVPADGNWHPVAEKLADCNAFEIVAKALGKKGRGQYAMAHAIAISVFGSRSSKVKVTQSHFGMFWNKIRFRWRGESGNYQLEMKTGTNYGMDQDKPIYIHYHIGKLWDDKMFFKTGSPAPAKNGK